MRYTSLLVFLALVALVVAYQPVKQEPVKEEDEFNYYYYVLVIIDIDYYGVPEAIGDLCQQAYYPIELFLLSIINHIAQADIKDEQHVFPEQKPFSDITDASECSKYPEHMQVDCLNAVIDNLESANEEMQEEMEEMADAEVTFIQLEMAGTTVSVLLILLAAFVCSCCCFSKKRRQNPPTDSLGYVVLQPMDTYNV